MHAHVVARDREANSVPIARRYLHFAAFFRRGFGCILHQVQKDLHQLVVIPLTGGSDGSKFSVKCRCRPKLFSASVRTLTRTSWMLTASCCSGPLAENTSIRSTRLANSICFVAYQTSEGLVFGTYALLQ